MTDACLWGTIKGFQETRRWDQENELCDLQRQDHISSCRYSGRDLSELT